MSANTSPQKRAIAPIFLYLGFGILILGLLIWSSLRLLQETPARQAGGEAPGLGWVSLTLIPEPFPPAAGEPVRLQVGVENSRGAAVDLGSELPFTIGPKGQPDAQLQGAAAHSGGGYLAQVQFPAPGDYWLAFDIGGGSEVRFQLDVQAAP